MSYPLAVCKAWVELVTGLSVIYDGDPEPTAPRPNVAADVYSYAAIGFPSDTRDTSTAHERTTDVDAGGGKVRQYRSQVRTGTLIVDLFGPGAADYARALELSMDRADVLRQLDAAGDFSISRPAGVDNEPELLSATREPQASTNFQIQWVDTEVYATEAVETVSVESTVNEE